MNKELYKAQILLVKALGESIGYGNLMEIASALWGQKLEKSGASDDGACYPMIITEIKDGELKEDAVRYRVQNYRLFKEFGIWDGDKK